ncbi:MAG: Holliday junction branch migration protein RuvA [candidate division WOR-3 bacterium]
MLESIKGVVLEINKEKITLDVGGFGVLVNAVMESAFPLVGDEIFLYTHLSMTQNGVEIYGFENKEERELFRTLIKIPNIGPKTAFSLMVSLGGSGIRKALDEENADLISNVKGIGSKTAKRIILELKDKLKFTPTKEFEEAKRALITIGYSAKEAEEAIREVMKKEKYLSVDEIVKKVLKET